MRVVFVDRRGAQAIWRLMDSVASALVARGDEVHYARWDDGRQREPLAVPAGVAVHEIRVASRRRPWGRMGDRIFRSWAFTRQFRALLAGLKPDIVHTHFAVPGASARRVAKQSGVPSVVTTQHELYGSMSAHLRIAVRRSERYADAVVYISRTVAQSYGHPEATAWPQAAGWGSGSPTPDKHWVISNGVDVADYAIAGPTSRAQSGGSGAPSGGGGRIPGRLLCLGRLVKVKGQDVLLRALPAVAAACPEAHVRFAGAGPEEATLRKLAHQLGVADRVEFLGWREKSEVIDQLHQAAAVIVPSDGTQEGFGLAAAEAMAAAAPIVATRIPVFEEVLGSDDDCAVMFDRGDPASLADAVCRVLDDPEGRQRRADRARERVESLFTSGKMVNGYLSLYDTLLTPKPLSNVC